MSWIELRSSLILGIHTISTTVSVLSLCSSCLSILSIKLFNGLVDLATQQLINCGIVVVRAQLARLVNDVIVDLLVHFELNHCCLQLLELRLSDSG